MIGRPSVQIDQVFSSTLCNTHHSRKTPIDLGVKKSKIKVTGQGRLPIPKNLFPDDISCLDWSIVFKLHRFTSLGEDPCCFLGQKFSVQNYRSE